MKKWIQKNWLYIILISIMGYLLVNDVVNSAIHKREIEARKDSIAILEYAYSELEKDAQLSSELVSAYKFALTTHQDSLQDLKTEIVNQKIRHEKQVANFSLIPTDSLYLDYIRWADTVSFE